MQPAEQKLWDELMVLVENSESFYYGDFYNLKRWWRIFNYRLASYTDFLAPSALECRGTMFEIDIEGKNAKPLRLAARPMQKFFNYRENPITMDVNLWDVDYIFDKADGSLISSYLVQNVVHLKSKGAVTSDQAMAAERLIKTAEYEDLYLSVIALEQAGYTVNMEYVAPDNRIVIGYMNPALIVLNARHRLTGEYMSPVLLRETVGEDRACLMYTFSNGDGLDEQAAAVEFLEQIPSMTGIEGVVVVMKDGLWMKLKTEAYLTAHRAKDSINSDRRLFEAVLEEATDDLRSLFYDDELALARIEEFEKKVDYIYNHTVDMVERFYERNKQLERKDYAILGQKELEKPHFGLAMSKYIGKPVDYKAYMRKNYKSFGIKDDPEPTGDE